ncbi:MAG: flagellar hook-length control protein FliK [Lachnospiraceae bacterium]|nr:flagellar hook-length control protein FliK [Lachnospiraceae bacterium]
MTDAAVRNGNAFFGANSANSVNPALSAVANAQKTASPAENKTQDFGAVLDKTVQKYEQKPTQPVTDSSTGTQTQQPGKETIQAEGENDNTIKDTDTAVDAVESDVADTQETVESDVPAVTDEPAGETVRIEEPVDQMTIDEITKALEQIIEQIKQILGITDDELLSGMDALGMQTYDLLNADNMAQLVTAISGEDSTVSLIANEELYTALQEITQTVDTQVGSLLENTGFTSEELDAVLQKLQEMESQELDDQLQDMEMLSPETTEEPAVDGQQEPEGPVIIREDNTRADEQPAKQYDKLPENQQDNPVEIGAKPQTQSTGKDTKGSDDKESGNFGQNNAAQNFQNNLSEAGAAATAEGVEKFTSESTENIMRQLADMVKIVKNENLTEMELQLHPASLGTVNVSLTTKGGMVTAEFTTQNEAVKAAIEAQATQLRANLEEQGVKVEAIEVSVESHQMERNLDKNGQEQQRQEQEQETMRVQGMRRGRSSINLRAFADGEELEGEMQGADDATRIAMEIMAANGNTMDLLV